MGEALKPPEPPSEFRLPDGTWSCVRDGVTEPCGDCDGCRQIAAMNAIASGPGA